MTYEQIEKEFDECWYRDDVKRGLYEGKLDKEYFKSFLKQSFIKYLQSEVEFLDKKKNRFNEDTETLANAGYSIALDDISLRLQEQLKELE